MGFGLVVGKTPPLRHPLYRAVMYMGKISNALLSISPVIPSSPCAVLFSMLATAFLISFTVNSLSSALSTGSWDCDLACLW